VEACDGGLRGFRVKLCEYWPLSLPLGKFVVLLVFALFAAFGTVRVVPADVVVELAMNVDVMFGSHRYLAAWESAVTVAVFHRCLRVWNVST